MKALRDVVVVKKVVIEDTTPSGLVLSAGPKAAQNVADVCFIGPDVKDVQVGDRVVVDVFPRVPVPHEGENLFFMPEESVLAVLPQ